MEPQHISPLWFALVVVLLLGAAIIVTQAGQVVP